MPSIDATTRHRFRDLSHCTPLYRLEQSGIPASSAPGPLLPLPHAASWLGKFTGLRSNGARARSEVGAETRRESKWAAWPLARHARRVCVCVCVYRPRQKTSVARARPFQRPPRKNELSNNKSGHGGARTLFFTGPGSWLGRRTCGRRLLPWRPSPSAPAFPRPVAKKKNEGETIKKKGKP